jgi:tetratricopeptide (TPR) repeat protein
MKKTFLTIAAALLVCLPTFAQEVKVNPASYQKKIEKSDADVAHAKKSTKASTWMKRAELMLDAENAYTEQIFESAPINLVLMKIGNPATQEMVTIGKESYIKLGYGAYDVYTDANGQMVMGWNVTEPIYEGAIDKAVEAYLKALELNPKLSKKVNLGFVDVQNALRKNANSKFFLQDYKAASDYFERAYELSIIPEAGLQVDDASIYNAGYLAFFAGDYERSIEKLRIAESHGYYAEGSIYNVLYNAYVSAYRDNKEKMTEAKEFLQKALVEFPTNSEIVSCMTDVYLVLGESPEPMIDILKGAIDADPQNPQLKIGLGAVYAELKKFDEAIAMFDEAIALEPGNINLYLNKAYTYTRKGDDLNKIANDMNWNDENRNGVIVSALEAYAASIEPFEQAHQLNPNDINTVEFLKSICFQVRNVKPEYMEKYNHYNALFKEMRGM